MNNVKVEFEKDEGTAPLNAMAERAKKYQKLEITYKMIREYMERKLTMKAVNTTNFGMPRRSIYYTE